MMELKISESAAIPAISWNYEELKTQIAEKMQEYASIAYTEDDEKAMKADKATINKFIKAIEDERKRMKNLYLEPYNKFEAQVKEVLQPARECVAVIDKGLGEIEQKYREEKLEKFSGYYKEYAGDMAEFIPPEKAFKKEFYNRTFTDKKMQQAVKDFFGVRRSDLDTIESMDTPYKDKILLEYGRTLDLQSAIREGKRAEELEKAMEQRRIQAEEQRKQKEAEEAAKAAMPEPVTQKAPEQIEEPQPKKREKRLRITFAVTASTAQFEAVNKILSILGKEAEILELISKEEL